MKPIRLRPLSDRKIREHSVGFDWDPTKPLAEQWPWNLASLMQSAPPSDPDWQAKVLDECAKIDERRRQDAFASEDTASREPWDAGKETPPADDDELTCQVAYCPPGSVQDVETKT